MIERLTGQNATSATQLAGETGVAQVTLSKWLMEARSLPVMAPRKRKPKVWSVEEKVRVLAEAGKLAGEQLSAMLAREGLQRATLEQWRLALGEVGDASKAATMRIRKLERELARKEKALAEAAALLILKKRLEHLWEDEDDGTDEGNET